MSEKALQTLISSDAQRWHLLDIVRSLALPDCWIGAGFVRNAVWDHLHGRALSPLTGDVDVLWFDATCTNPSEDRRLEALLHAAEPSIDWSVKNQARMHLRNGDAPYRNAKQQRSEQEQQRSGTRHGFWLPGQGAVRGNSPGDR